MKNYTILFHLLYKKYSYNTPIKIYEISFFICFYYRHMSLDIPLNPILPTTIKFAFSLLANLIIVSDTELPWLTRTSTLIIKLLSLLRWDSYFFFLADR